jgi:hypothetical protein
MRQAGGFWAMRQSFAKAAIASQSARRGRRKRSRAVSTVFPVVSEADWALATCIMSGLHACKARGEPASRLPFWTLMVRRVDGCRQTR